MSSCGVDAAGCNGRGLGSRASVSVGVERFTLDFLRRVYLTVSTVFGALMLLIEEMAFYRREECATSEQGAGLFRSEKNQKEKKSDQQMKKVMKIERSHDLVKWTGRASSATAPWHLKISRCHPTTSGEWGRVGLIAPLLVARHLLCIIRWLS